MPSEEELSLSDVLDKRELFLVGRALTEWAATLRGLGNTGTESEVQALLARVEHEQGWK